MEHYMFSAFPRRGHRLNFRFNSKAPRKCCTISFPYTPKTFAKGLSANMALSFEQRKWMLKCYWKTENINYVVMRGFNEDEVCSFVELTKEKNVDVRFIEYMPFSGNKWNDGNMVSFSEMLQIIRKQWPNFDPLPNGPNDTSKRCNTKQMQ
ncbi:molybdenum cofactor biosynthesis protein 1-like isoform X3 [Schistocerca serialis cubense]|uniref:molybdenum cofactor biosynthesis protein 1-like n=1 Tax=Schistocerca serialis cubense TaxID=2023355 RepID=UPI00214E1481|nr:molybdenum cofactor biosynthesis protein 1-like [Schistocerca serialis cubense]XP_049941856.1 molybdenum cofactor biosynthesis protein 1-like isoform X3 [Schistocerca serialis cubense]